MNMSNKRALPERLKSLLYLAAGTVGLLAALRYLLPWIAPFIISLSLALAAEPLVRLFTARLRLPRAAASGICTVLILGLLVFLAVLIAGKVTGELSALSLRMPDIAGRIGSWLEGRTLYVRDWAESAPPGIGTAALSILESLPGELARLAGSISGAVISAIPTIAKKTPEILLFAVTAGIGLYFVSSEYPKITEFVRRQVPARHRARAGEVLKDFSSSIGSWLKAQLFLTLITFLELTFALTLMRAEYAIIMAAIISVVDLLPILGTGTVLLPWAAASFLSGDVSFALGLAITYGAVTLLRNLIQAKLVGDQLGLNPLVSLLSMYAGFKMSGITGMIILPIAVITVIQLNDRGILRLWSPARNKPGCESEGSGRNMEKRKSKAL